MTNPPHQRPGPLPRHQTPHPQQHQAPYGQGPYARPENVQRPQPPPPRYTPPPPERRQAPPPAPRNGLGLAAVIVAPIGIVFGLVPLTGFVAVICGLVAIPLALVGYSRYKRGHATNGKTAITGAVIGTLAVALGVWGISIVFQTLDDLGGPAPAAIGAPGEAQTPAAATAPTTAQFGQRITYENGLAVEVTVPEGYRPGQYSAGHDRDRAVRFEVTVVNGTGEQIDAVTAFVRGTHGGRDAPMIFDSANGLTGPPAGVILPGNSITFPVAMSIGAEPGVLQVDVTPGFLSDPAVFTGDV